MKRTGTPKQKKTSPESAREDFLIVGIGASAGGIQALKTFFENVPADSGLAFVVILHLSPDHDSQLAEVLQTVAAIHVTQVKKRVKVEPNRVYVVPPNEHLTMIDGEIEVTPNLTTEDRRAPVDIFFRTLAESHKSRAVAVVLSGTGSNGSMGLKRVKEQGGAAYVQNPREAEFSEMPRNSIATDLVDRILNVAEIPAQIIAYKKGLGKIEIPVEPQSRDEEQQQALREIFNFLRLRTGHDFSNYKRPTILRRIERRINIQNLPDLPAYAAFFRENPDEATALLKDLLISVTNFFRDKDPFNYLETEILPKIFEGKTAEDQVRIWVCGCATGEEAYSLAMVCAEQTSNLSDAPEVQIFATDIDEQAIAAARDGFYTLNDAADVSPERLRRFFTKETDGFRIRRELREMVLFANHNLLKDPPFSHLDLVTCRNLLIYLNPAAQERVMETFHFALESSGFMLLGNSETVDGAGDLFVPVSREHHIFQSRKVLTRNSYSVANTSSLRSFRFEKTKALQPVLPAPERGTRSNEQISYGELHLRLLEQYTPSVVVNEEYEIVHLSASATKFLQIKGGELSQNLLEMIRPELRLELRAALFQAAQNQTNITVRNLSVNAETINLHILPVLNADDTARGFVLVLFENIDEIADAAEILVASAPEPLALRLEEELTRSKSQLRLSAEQFEAQTEELKASNEEHQAMNEELRSAMEELETSKEELQSVNEELVTVNQELKIKVEELSHSNNDLSNLIASTDIGTIFLDRAFRVKMFTPPAREIFNFIPTDLGRPFSDITNRLETGDLIRDAKTVLQTLQTVEHEARLTDGRIFLLRISPYRTANEHIGGIVITSLDISGRINAEEHLRSTAQQLQLVTDAIPGLVSYINAERRYGFVNQRYRDWFGLAPEEIIGKTVSEVLGEAAYSEICPLMDKVFSGEAVHIEKLLPYKDGGARYVSINYVPDRDEKGTVIGYYALIEDISKRIEAEKALRESEERTGIAVEAAELATWDWNLKTNEIHWNERHFLLLGLKPHKNPVAPETFFKYVHEDDRDLVKERLENAVENQTVFEAEFRVRLETGKIRWMEGYGKTVETSKGKTIRMCGVMSDITERVNYQEKLRRSEERLQKALEIETIGVAFVNEQDKFTDCNDTFLKMSGYTREDIISRGISWHDITPPEWLLRSHEAAAELKIKGRTTPYEKEYIRKDGSRFWGLFTASMLSENEAVKYIIDISDRKRIEEKMRESEERLRLLIESVEDYAIFTMSLDGTINSWNTGAEKVFGWTESEVVGQSCAIIFTPEDRAKKAPEKEMKTALKMGRAPDERFHLRRDGTRFYVSGVMTLLKDADGKLQGFVKIARDLSDQIKTEKAVRDKEMLQKLVGALEDERRRIARDLHDELGQQLTALRLNLEKARGMCEDEDVCAEIDKIQLVAKNIDDGVDFLAWELRPAALDQFGLISALDNYVKQWTLYSGVSAELLASSLKRKRFAREIETNLYRIVQEALNNVHKHAGAKNVEIMLEKRGDLIVLIIQDDGRGFNVKSKTIRGKGIGLIGMKERAALIDGSFEIESALGEGTTIFVRVPAVAIKKGGSNGK